ncbi:hypothetical protein RND71_026509 [Anisodus tanguticus]|uniref:Ribonuclease H1 N-terminal domain-containing protein n=1 Tax=Anisodus tanguticus TaxID=243964 RepID=A0AAE1RMI4_9SOLA|nr:hypothetical protein RND71_026509 [Anisodus tanguticus]
MSCRPKKQRRREATESKKSGKFPRTCIQMTSSTCKGKNHNKRSCAKGVGSSQNVIITKGAGPSTVASNTFVVIIPGARPRARQRKETIAPEAPPRPRSRPRKESSAPEAPPRPRDKPRKETTDVDPKATLRPRGRLRKDTTNSRIALQTAEQRPLHSQNRWILSCDVIFVPSIVDTNHHSCLHTFTIVSKSNKALRAHKRDNSTSFVRRTQESRVESFAASLAKRIPILKILSYTNNKVQQLSHSNREQNAAACASLNYQGVAKRCNSIGFKTANLEKRFKFYVVIHGKTKGIFQTWIEVVDSIKDFKTPLFKGFNEFTEVLIMPEEYSDQITTSLQRLLQSDTY